jgi:hypothetical protein
MGEMRKPGGMESDMGKSEAIGDSATAAASVRVENRQEREP